MNRVLIIDDDPVTRAVLKVMLTRLDREVIEADDVASGIEATEHEDFATIICDYMLPDGTGLDVLEARPSLAERFILLTGMSERDKLDDDRIADCLLYTSDAADE